MKITKLPLCISAIIPAAILIAISTWPLSTSPARFLNTISYRGPKGRLRQSRVVKVDCALHMFITTPLPKFIDSPVKKSEFVATRKSTWRRCYEELNNELVQSQIDCLLGTLTGVYP
jgi:hypothetical protein